jgi:hypothetical protein
MRFIEKMRQKQISLEDSFKQRRIDKEQRYRDFLANTNRRLPSYESLALWRNMFLSAGFMLLVPVWCQVMFYNRSCYEPGFEWFPPILTCGTLILWIFAMLIDMIIIKRWKGEKKTLLLLTCL